MARRRDSSELDRILGILQREALNSPCFQNSHLTRWHAIGTECPSCVGQGVRAVGSWEGEPLLVIRVIGAEERGDTFAGDRLVGEVCGESG